MTLMTIDSLRNPFAGNGATRNGIELLEQRGKKKKKKQKKSYISADFSGDSVGMAACLANSSSLRLFSASSSSLLFRSFNSN